MKRRKINLANFKIEEKALVNLLERFVENALDYHESNKTVNQRFDATSISKKECHFYMSKIDWVEDINECYPPEIRYQIKIISCWGKEIEIIEDQNVNEEKSEDPYRFKAYFDDTWCFGNDNEHKYSKSRILSYKANNLILKILECANYKNLIKYEEEEEEE
jgi:hypothetical protein